MARRAFTDESMQPAMMAFVACLFVLSPNLLYALGIHYSLSTGSALAKIHPAFYGAVLLLGYYSVRGGVAKRAGPADMAALLLAAVTVLAILAVASTTVERGGGEMSALLTTFLLPALVVLVMRHANAATVHSLPMLLGVLFLINSTLALAESRTGLRLLPFVAGDAILDFDRRPTALFGHPLANAALTGGWVLFLGMQAFRNGLRPLLLLMIALHVLALVAFGGRAAVAAAAGALLLYMFVHTLAELARGGGGREIMRGLALTALGLALVPVVLWSGIADLVIARFLDGRGSNETRIAALHILAELDAQHWWAGAPVSLRAALQARFGTPLGIELSWAALAITFGLPIAAALLSATGLLLWAAGSGGGLPAAMLGVYFVAVTFASLSIASKSLLISQFLILLISTPRAKGGVRVCRCSDDWPAQRGWGAGRGGVACP